MGKTVDESLKRMNPTGIPWEDMTEEQRIELREMWDKVVSIPENLDCSCFRTGCRNNRNCKNCLALHRYYDGLSYCLSLIVDKMQEEVPQEKRYNMHYKIQAAGKPEGSIDYTVDPNEMRKIITKDDTPADRRKRADEWAAIVKKPKNTACNCPRTDCWYHGNCVKCIALHRYYQGFPNCVRYIADEVDDIVEAHRKSIAEQTD